MSRFPGRTTLRTPIGILAATLVSAVLPAQACSVRPDPPAPRLVKHGVGVERTGDDVSTEPIAADDATFWIWIPSSRYTQPGFGAGYWSDPSVFPLIQAHVDLPDKETRNAPGRRVDPNDNTDYDKVDSWVGKNPEAAADQMVGWAAWYRDKLRSLGREDFRYALWLNGFGAPPLGGKDYLHNRRNVWTLGTNPADAIDAAISDRGRVGVFFSEQGRRLNAEWSARYCNRFDERLASFRLSPPSALHFDLEAVFDINAIAQWWEPALDDPRASTELIDGRRTLRELSRRAPAFWPDSGTFARANKPFLYWAMGVGARAVDYVLWEGFWKQAREVWPDVQLSNYQLTPASRAHPYPYPYMYGEMTNTRFQHATHAAPVLYPLNDWAFENGRVTVGDQLRRFGGRPRGNTRRDLNKLNFMFSKARLDACIENNTRVAAWIRPPNPEKLNMEYTVRLIRYGMRHGVDQWILWSGDGYDWSELLERVRAEESP